MPIQNCRKDGKPGVRYGTTGKCYTYIPGNRKSRQAAIARAQKQMAAIRASRGK